MKAYGLVYIPDWTNGDGVKHPLSIALMQIPLELAVHFGSDKPINMIFLSEGFNDGPIFASEAGEELGVKNKGWGIFESDDPDNCNIYHPNPLEVGCNAAIQGTTNTGVELSFGTCNEELKQIFSITPFTAGKQPVPNSGYVDAIKFNTNLSQEEVDKIITEANLSYINAYGMTMYPVFMDVDTKVYIAVVDATSALNTGTHAYQIINLGTEELLYSTPELTSLGASVSGWNSNFNGVMEVKAEAHSDIAVYATQNDKLVDLVYIGSEPFKKELTGTYEAVTTDITENGEVDLTTYWDNQQMPIKINVNVEGSRETGTAITVSSSTDMDALLVEENVGKIYKFVGVTDEKYTNGQYYIIEEV